MMTAPPTQAAFYREFVMARKLEPREYGVDMEREAFVDLLADDFNSTYRGQQTIDSAAVCVIA